MGFGQPPVDFLAEERIDMLVADGFAWAVEVTLSQLRMLGINLMPRNRHKPKTGSL